MVKEKFSPYLELSRDKWKSFRMETPLPLSASEIEELKGQQEAISPKEVEEIYLPLSRLLNLYVGATQDLYRVTTRFLGHPEPRVPYIIGIAGSVAVGKSTVSRTLKALLSKWPHHPRVEIVPTDGYLYPSRILNQRGIMARKGFPESYNIKALIQFLSDLKAGVTNLKVPVYSHYFYDTLENEFQTIHQPDIVIVEGLNVLQVGNLEAGKAPPVFVSDFFDFSIYVDAPTDLIRSWYLERFMILRENAKKDSKAFFYPISQLSDEEALRFAKTVWADINEVNLEKNILPHKERARLILEKGTHHEVQNVLLRKI